MIKKEWIDEIIKNSEVIAQTRLGRITIVTVVLPNGFAITETSTSATVEEYDYMYGVQQCLKKVQEKLYEFEMYRLLTLEIQKAHNEQVKE